MTTASLWHEDSEARRLALTALDRTILVEAGAGSGKTSILAGRVVALLAAGRPPSAIAAITFTELAASELRERIAKFVEELIAGHVRPDLTCAFGAACTDPQAQALRAARDDLDQLTCCTIHSFCQALLTPYPVEADMDPGAAVMDRQAADVLFKDVVDNFLRERLSQPLEDDDLLVALFLDDAAGTRGLIETIAGQLRGHPDLGFAQVAAGPHPANLLRERVKAFRRFIDRASCREPDTAAIVAGLETSIEGLPEAPDPDCAALIRLLRLAAPAVCAKADGDFSAYRAKTKWKAAAKASRTLAEADRLNDAASACYKDCAEAFAAAKAWAAGLVLHRLGGECRTIVARFTAAKRDRALLDFDDLMLKARDLLVRRADIRDALARRFPAILVDEFQDTDPLQCEIIWRLAGRAPSGTPDAPWSAWRLAPGSLFLVGDPKQAIYRFRGADVGAYVAVRDILRREDPAAVVGIAQNFRSVEGILAWVNQHFVAPLSAEGQPGFAHLFAAASSRRAGVSVAGFGVPVEESGAEAIRDAEAEAVASLCDSLIGSHPVRQGQDLRPCEPDDIALLAPSGTDLWRYERALEERGIAVSTQAGKGFFRRQEIQDLIALTRILADSRDTLALGAFLRGPMVGLTEEALLDAVAALPQTALPQRPEEGDPPRLGVPTEIRASIGPVFPPGDDSQVDALISVGALTLWTDSAPIADPLLRETLEILQSLARGAGSTTPYLLLCAAVEALHLRPILRRRRGRTAERALANLDLYLELARPFDVQGLKAFADAMRRQWQDATRAMEARPDTQRRAVSLITMHSSKGLEWPIVVPINSATAVRSSTGAVLERRTGLLHLPVFGVHPAGAAEAIEAEKAEVARERHRIWYVATTRARDLLVLPQLSREVPKNSWMAMLSAGFAAIEPLTLPEHDKAVLRGAEAEPEGPDRASFEAQAAVIRANTQMLQRLTPHLAEAGDEPRREAEILGSDSDGPVEVQAAPRGSLTRGLVLHKLIEEVLTGETAEDAALLAGRAAELGAELGAEGLDLAELAGCVLRGLAVPEVVAVRPHLVPECWVAASRREGAAETVTIGIADALAVSEDGRITLVIDWKSDVTPDAAVVASYRAQVAAYLDATGAPQGLIVFLTSGMVERVQRQ